MTDSACPLVPAHFGSIAGRYAGAEGGLEPVYAAARPRLERLIEGRDVLDVGGGGATPYDASRAASLTALDLSAAMLARLRDARARRVVGDAREMPLPDARFDLVLFNLSLHHVVGADAAACREGGRRALREAWRVLRPGGDLAVHEPLAGPVLAGLQRALYAPLRAALSARGAAPVFLRTLGQAVEDMAAAAGAPPVSVEETRLNPRGWSDPLGGTFPGVLRLPLALHPTRFALLRLRKHG